MSLLKEFHDHVTWLHARDRLPSARIRKASDKWSEEQKARVLQARRLQIALHEKARAEAFLSSIGFGSKKDKP